MASPDRDTAVGALNRLLLAEHAGLLRRLGESAPFVSWASADKNHALREMIQQESEHAGWLTAAILDLGGVPAPRRLDVSTADMHYCDLHSLIPRIVADKQRLIDCYEQALVNLKGAPAAAEVAGRILTRHREHLETLQAMLSTAAG